MAKVFVIALLLALVAGLGYLAMWEIPAPSAPVEKVIPDDRFQR